MASLRDIFRSRSAAAVPLPEGLRIYAVGDIHGRLDLLRRLAEAIRRDIAASPVKDVTEVFVGDYVDRGPHSRGVIDWLAAPPAAGTRRVCLRGNHEAVLLDFLANPAIAQQWRAIGGFDTLYSYGVQPPLRGSKEELAAAHSQFLSALPPQHRRFLESLPLSVEFGGYFFCHAGVNPNRPISEQRDEDLLWIRDPFLNSTKDFGRIVVHGHTPCEQPEIRPNRINIDTGAYITGRLTCLVLEGDTKRFLA